MPVHSRLVNMIMSVDVHRPWKEWKMLTGMHLASNVAPSSSSSFDKTKLVFSEYSSCNRLREVIIIANEDQQLFTEIACLEASQFWDFLEGFSGYSMVQWFNNSLNRRGSRHTVSFFNQILVQREQLSNTCTNLINNARENFDTKMLNGTVWSSILGVSSSCILP